MKKRSLFALKIAIIFSLVLSLLSGCGSPDVKDTYPLESVNKDGSSTSYVYRAANKNVPEVASELANQKEPEQISKQDSDRMFLVYKDEMINVQKDPKNPNDALIEVDSIQYVKNNYDSSFLQGYLTATLIGHLFDGLGSLGKYRGYSSADVYKPKTQYHIPTDNDKKLIPPMTVERKGLITRRGMNSDSSSDRVGSGGSIFSKGNTSKGTISRDKDSSKSSIFGSPKRSYSIPKTKSGFGKISRRGRR
ncbi:DUF4247 domain-containing protein [Paenibacillus sediminis]|uniref:DUF4247 domain-containing protein n=1 Tax=Paenibacillus sediminis TaxID=664909 RepID=A0ABS4H0A8_9BACL|nr:DUF4247 domain-containing protein [Paenibacillus sediminis]MBP1935963.1 hypothetical protein [Paenibacillus sediminis]